MCGDDGIFVAERTFVVLDLVDAGVLAGKGI